MSGSAAANRSGAAWALSCSLLVLAFTLAVFSRTLAADFVFWDDDHVIYRNPGLAGPSIEAVRWAFTNLDTTQRYTPLTLLAYSAIYGVAGLEPFGYHVVNWALHGANAVALFLVLVRLLSLRPGAAPDTAGRARTHALALVASLLWAVHPLRVEPVAWASTLSYGLAILWILVSLLFYLEANAPPATRPGRRKALLALSLLAYALSLLSLVVGVTFWAVYVLIDAFLLDRVAPLRGRWISREGRAYLAEKFMFLVPAALLLAANVVARIWFSWFWEEMASTAEFGLLDRAAQAAYLATQYAYRQAWPVDLAPIYSDLIRFDPLSFPFVARALCTIALAGTIVLARRRLPGAGPFLLAYFIVALPVLGLLEHPYFPCDRYSAVPSLVLTAAAAFVARKVSERSPSPTRALASLLAPAAAALALLAILTVRQAAVWRNTETLLAHTISVTEDAEIRQRMWNRLGVHFTDTGNFDKAASSFKATIDIDPQSRFAAFALHQLASLPE